eukprot:m.165116 g.165116  ORF g.165116 m.165116 type:complete len:72 (-) comp14419_c0_seq3:772-987(-)
MTPHALAEKLVERLKAKCCWQCAWAAFQIQRQNEPEGRQVLAQILVLYSIGADSCSFLVGQRVSCYELEQG